MKIKPYLYALATLIGTTIGVGIFGVPYVMAESGFWLCFIYLGAIGFLLVIINLLYGEVVLRDKGRRRLVGSAELYFGEKGKHFTGVMMILSFWGNLLAYIIVGGTFLNIILNPVFGGSEFIYSLVFFIAGTIVIFTGLKLISLVEAIVSILLFAIIFVIVIIGLPKVDIANYWQSDFANLFLPYGVILFALGSASAIPELEDILAPNRKKDLKKVIVWGGIISIIVTLIFSAVVLGVSGQQTSPEAIFGLLPYLGKPIVIIGAIFGFLALITSFLVIGANLNGIFKYDYKLKPYKAIILTSGIPLLLFLFASQNFIRVIDITGGVFGSLTGLVIIAIFYQARKVGYKKPGFRKPEFELKIKNHWLWLIAFFFFLGFVYQVLQIF